MSYLIDLGATTGSGLLVRGLAAEALGDRRLIYVNSVGSWSLADADAAATMPTMGITMEPIPAGMYGEILVKGAIGLSTWTWTLGGRVYASTVAGELTQTAPTAVGTVVQAIGIATTATMIYVDPKLDIDASGFICPILEGATAYVGFDECKEPLTNYFYCDGTADDVQIQQAIDYVDGLDDGSVNLEAGTYDITSQIVPVSNLWLYGVGPATILKANVDAYTDWGVISDNLVQLENITISDLQIDGSGDVLVAFPYVAIGIQASHNVLIKNVLATNMLADGISISGRGSARYPDNIWVVECRVYDFGKQVNDSGGFEVDDGSSGVYFVDCRAETGGTGAHGFDVHTWSEEVSPTNVRIMNCYAENVTRGLQIWSGLPAPPPTVMTEDVIVIGFSTNGCTNYGVYGYNCKDVKIIGGKHRGASVRFIDTNITNLNIAVVNVEVEGTVTGAAYNNAIAVYAEGYLISGCTVHEAEAHGMKVEGKYGIVTDNICKNNAQVEAFGCGINVNGLTDGIVVDNECYDEQGAPTQAYGIRTDGVCTGTVIRTNKLQDNLTGPFLRNGSGEIFETIPIYLIQGTTFISTVGEAWGWSITADTNFALGIGWLPLHVQQVVNIRVIGVALAAPGAGDYMRIQITGEGGTFDENFATEPIDVVNHNNEEVNVAIDDVVNWIFDPTDDADIGQLLGGDRLQLKVLHEGAGNGDAETNAIVDTVQVEYV